jgi:hypothetical protein
VEKAMGLETMRGEDHTPEPRFASSFLERFDQGGRVDDGLLHESLAGLSDQELGTVLEAAVEAASARRPSGPEAARVLQIVLHSARIRFQPYARRIARTYCIRLSHRSDVDACRSGCETVAVLDGPVLDRIVGSEAPKKRRDGTWAHGLGYLYEWATSGFRMYDKPDGPVAPFNQHLARRSHHGWSDELLRTWNDNRGLVQRLRVGGAKARAFEARLDSILLDRSLLDRIAKPFEWPRTTEVQNQSGAQAWAVAWLDALYTDACQTPVSGTTIDVLRVARRLDARRRRIDRLPRSQPERELAYRLFVDGDACAAWSELVARVDGAVREVLPETYRRLDAARDVTQASVGLGIRDQAGSDDDEGDRAADTAGPGDVMEDALGACVRTELENLFASSIEVTTLADSGFAIDGFHNLLVAVERARSELRDDEPIPTALGRILRPERPPTDDEILRLEKLITRTVSIIQGEELP